MDNKSQFCLNCSIRVGLVLFSFHGYYFSFCSFFGYRCILLFFCRNWCASCASRIFTRVFPWEDINNFLVRRGRLLDAWSDISLLLLFRIFSHTLDLSLRNCAFGGAYIVHIYIHSLSDDNGTFDPFLFCKNVREMRQVENIRNPHPRILFLKLTATKVKDELL